MKPKINNTRENKKNSLACGNYTTDSWATIGSRKKKCKEEFKRNISRQIKMKTQLIQNLMGSREKVLRKFIVDRDEYLQLKQNSLK